MGMKARIVKLEKHVPPDGPTGSAAFFHFADTNKLVHAPAGGGDLIPASENDMEKAQQQGRQVVIFHFPSGTVYKPPRKPTTNCS